MKYYIQSLDGVTITCVTTTPQMDGEDIMPNYYEVDNPSDDLINNYTRYKLVDGMPEKMEQKEYESLHPQSSIETLQQENHLLKAQVKALTEQGEFQDELIAEIATVVYA